MDIQLFIVIIIGILVGVILINYIYKFFITKKDSPFCGSCSGCDISETYGKKIIR